MVDIVIGGVVAFRPLSARYQDVVAPDIDRLDGLMGTVNVVADTDEQAELAVLFFFRPYCSPLLDQCVGSEA